MSTTINVTVDDGGLPARNRQQTAANRQAFVQGRASQQAAQQGVDQRAADRRAAGLDPTTGRPTGSSSRLPRVTQEPAASRRLAVPGYTSYFVNDPSPIFNNLFINKPYTFADASFKGNKQSLFSTSVYYDPPQEPSEPVVTSFSQGGGIWGNSVSVSNRTNNYALWGVFQNLFPVASELPEYMPYIAIDIDFMIETRIVPSSSIVPFLSGPTRFTIYNRNPKYFLQVNGRLESSLSPVQVYWAIDGVGGVYVDIFDYELFGKFIGTPNRLSIQVDGALGTLSFFLNGERFCYIDDGIPIIDFSYIKNDYFFGEIETYIRVLNGSEESQTATLYLTRFTPLLVYKGNHAIRRLHP